MSLHRRPAGCKYVVRWWHRRFRQCARSQGCQDAEAALAATIGGLHLPARVPADTVGSDLRPLEEFMVERMVAMSRIVLAMALILAILSAIVPSTATAQFARPGGTMVIGAGNDPGQFNPGITTAGGTHFVTGNIYNGLLMLDEQFNPMLHLAVSWIVSSDGM